MTCAGLGWNRQYFTNKHCRIAHEATQPEQGLAVVIQSAVAYHKLTLKNSIANQVM